jgi:hypothetical protein
MLRKFGINEVFTNKVGGSASPVGLGQRLPELRGYEGVCEVIQGLFYGVVTDTKVIPMNLMSNPDYTA